MKMKTLACLLAACVVGGVMSLSAATYYWKGPTGDSSYGEWSNTSNWSTEGVGGADAATAPGAADKFYGYQDRSIDLEGNTWSIGGWDSSGVPDGKTDADWHSYTMNLSNGTLNVVGNVTTHSDVIGIRSGAKLIFAEGTTFTPAIWDGGKHCQYVHSGGEVDILGNLRIYNYGLVVYGGGTAVVRSTKVDVYGDTAQKSYFQNDGGTLSLPSGLEFSSGSTSAGFRFSVVQNSGTLELGGPVSKNGKPGEYVATFAGGTVVISNDVSFVLDSATMPANASITLQVLDGSSVDMSSFTYGSGTTINKTGAGDFLFANGMTLPDTFEVAAGAIALNSANTSYDISGVTFSSDGKVKIGATGVTLTNWDASLLSNGGFVSGVATPVVGSTLFSCADASVLALAKAGLDGSLPDGFAVTINGNDLIVSSAYVFDSTTVTDLNDPAGWAGGAVPSNKVVTIKGAGVSPTTTDLPPFAGMTIMDGASLTIANGGTIPSLTLADSAALTISSGTVTLGSAPTISPSGANRPSVTIASGATLNVPGATTFTDCSLSVSGTLATTSAGDLVLGYAAAGDTASFGLTVNGGTLSTTSGDIRFFCPASGGTVTPLGTNTFTGATFVHDDDHGFQFGINNPTSTAVVFTFDNTTLNYPRTGNYYVSGGSALRFVNGGSLYRARGQNYRCMFYVNGLASIYLGPGTSSFFGDASDNGGSVGNGEANFSADVNGHVMLTLDNAEIEMYHSAGNSTAVVEVFGTSKHPVTHQSYNRKQPFGGFKSVNLNSGATLTLENHIDSATMNTTKNYTGAGSLFFTSPRTTTRTLRYQSTVASATGTLSADPDKNAALAITNTATWAGTVVWNGKASIDHTAAADAMTFGGIDLASDFTWRIWGDGTCDHYTLTGAGFVDHDGKVVINVMDGSEADAGDAWTIARVPATSAVPSPASSAWTITTRAVDGDDTVVDLVLSPVATDFVFESDEYTDLCAAAGWANGSVPTNQDVKVSGSSTVAMISDAAVFPAFASIAVRNGATLKVLADVALPPLTVDATSKVVFGDNATQPAVSAVLNAMLTTSYDTSVSPVALPVIEIATNATLSVASDMKFKNVDFRLYGTITKASNDDASPVFGYAENGETSYLAFTADGGVFDFHSNYTDGHDSYGIEKGSISFVFPSSGGTVIPVGTLTLRNVTRTVIGWADYGNWEFCRNNPTNISVDVVVDGTHMDVSGYFYASGAAHLTLRNGSWLRRNSSCIGHWFPMAIQDAATIVLEDGCYIDFATNDGKFGIDSQTDVDAVTVSTGGIYAVTYNSSGYQRGVFVSDGGVLGVTKLAYPPNRSDLLQGFGSARLDGDLTIASIDGIGTGSYNWNRHVKVTDKPFTGAGDVTVTNGVPAYPFTVTMVNGANTATGSIKVAKADGDVETALYFADGANWAGTVVAGNVALTNLTDGAATATFGTLDLAADFNIRVWTENGVVVTNDMVNVGEYQSHGGRLSMEPMTEGLEFAAGDKIVVGKIAKASPDPAVKAGWCVKRLPIDGDDANELLVAKKGIGLQLILR